MTSSCNCRKTRSDEAKPVYAAGVTTPQAPSARVELHALMMAVENLGETQRLLGDVLRSASVRMGGVEASTVDTNQRMRALEESVAEIKEMLARVLDK